MEPLHPQALVGEEHFRQFPRLLPLLSILLLNFLYLSSALK